ERRDRIMAAQQPIAFAFNQSLVGRRLDVLVDSPSPEGKHVWTGRTFADAPDVDGVVYLKGPELVAGDMVPCEISSSEGYDLVARTAGPPPPRLRRARPRPRRRPASPFTILE